MAFITPRGSAVSVARATVHEIEELSASYIAAAMAKLGVDFTCPERIDVGQLDVAPRHHRLCARFFEILGEYTGRTIEGEEYDRLAHRLNSRVTELMRSDMRWRPGAVELLEDLAASGMVLRIETDDEGTLTSFVVRQEVPDTPPVQRPHRLVIVSRPMPIAGKDEFSGKRNGRFSAIVSSKRTLPNDLPKHAEDQDVRRRQGGYDMKQNVITRHRNHHRAYQGSSGLSD